MLDTPTPSKLQGEIAIIQHNTAKKLEAQFTLLEIAARRKADIVLV